MSRKQIITFIAGRHFNTNSSQYGEPCGLTCRFTFTMTCFSLMSPLLRYAGLRSLVAPLFAMTMLVASSLCRVVSPRPRCNLRNVYGFIVELNFAVDPLRPRRFQPVRIVAFREIRFIVRAARFVSGVRADRDHARQNQHIAQLACEV